jgi:hypothetical protein
MEQWPHDSRLARFVCLQAMLTGDRLCSNSVLCLVEKLEWHGSSRDWSWDFEVLNGLGEYLYNHFWSFFPMCKVDAKGSEETQGFRMCPIHLQFQQFDLLYVG